jgi:hypothetical protein
MNYEKIEYINKILCNSYIYDKLVIGTKNNKYVIDYSNLNNIDKTNFFDIINEIPKILKIKNDIKTKVITL